MEEESAVDRWRRLSIHSDIMTARDQVNIEELLFAAEKRIASIPAICRKEQEQGYFGSDELYHQVLRAAEMSIFMYSIWKLRQVDRRTESKTLAQKVIDESDAKLPALERAINALLHHCPAAQLNKTLFGCLRWKLYSRVRSAQPDAPLSVSMLWASLFAALWLCCNSEINHGQFITDCSAIVGSNELVLFSLVLSCLHVHYGVLPQRLYEILLEINSTIM